VAPPAKRPKPAQTHAQKTTAPANPVPNGAPANPVPNGATASGVFVVVLMLFALGLLFVSASAVPPGRVPWPAVSESLYLHRSDLTVLGIGTMALGLVCLNFAVLF